eukprot:GFYU01016525.1.p1 GENE.GFYU01016525.1~~GFYU01016525.1.p1  ORF type:complete len:135 (-),score=24.16 GFYU01016525.1:32-376(-)
MENNSLFKHNDGLGGNPFTGAGPMFEGTKQSSAMVRHTELFGDSFSVWSGVNPYTGETCKVNLLCVIPLTKDEYEWRREAGSDAMHEVLSDQLGYPPEICRHDRPEAELPELED